MTDGHDEDRPRDESSERRAQSPTTRDDSAGSGAGHVERAPVEGGADSRREADEGDGHGDQREDGDEGVRGEDGDGEGNGDDREDTNVEGSGDGLSDEPSTQELSPAEGPRPGVPDPASERTVPEDVGKYAKFKKMDGAQYDRVNEFLRDRTYITAREWAIARLCADFRTETGVEMTKIGEHLPELVPFMTDTYTPQAVNQARASFDEKVRKAGATFLYGAMCDFFTAEELDDVMYEVTEVAKFLLEVEGVDLTVEAELEAEERISSVMREVREASESLRESDEESASVSSESASSGAEPSESESAGSESSESESAAGDPADGESTPVAHSESDSGRE